MSKIKKVLKWMGITFVGLIILGVIVGNGDDTETTTSTSGSAAETAAKPEEKPAETQEKIYAKGELIKTNKVELVVTGIEIKDSVGNEYVNKTASTGGVFVAVQYTMKNTTNKPISSFSFPSVQMIDSNKTKYKNDLEASVNYSMEKGEDNSKVLSDLNPGIQVNNSAVFEISKEQLDKGGFYILIDGKHKVNIQ